jgi:hypothetical protein
MSNNPFLIASGRVQPAPAPTPPNPSVPKVVILDPFAEGVTEYAISWDQLTALETVFIVANVTSIGPSSIPFYLPAVSSTQSGTKITIKSMSANLLTVACGAGCIIDDNVRYAQNIYSSAGATTSVLTSITYIADGQLTPQWYTIYNFYKI